MAGVAQRRVARFVVAAVVASALFAPAGHAAPLPASSTPLPGSTFQGGDGDQDDQAPYADWQGLHAAERVVHTLDPNKADSAFTSGSKEDNPGDWGLTTEAGGVNPGKDNILDAFSVVDQPGTDTFLYLGFARERSEGDTYLAFELNRDSRLWDNGRAEIPCRRTGDVLVAVTAHGNGIEIVLERWTTTETDAATSCATHGRLTRVASVPAGSAQGEVNGAPIVSRLPGFHPESSTIADAGIFGETALNLSSLLATAFDDRCLAFGSIWMHSRSSTSESSNLQDYLAPRPLSVRTCAASGVKFFDLNANGRRDSGEPGIPRFVIWADYDGDGRRDGDEPATVSDDQGRYVLDDIRPPGGTYTLRETLFTGRRATATNWICSFPNADTLGGFGDGPGGLFGCGWGPISTVTTPHASKRDFGNWLPARLTVRKRLWPPGDPGRFDLKVNGQTVLPGAGDGATTTIAVPPGSYDITEAAVPPTDADDYRSSVRCRSKTRDRGVLRRGTGYQSLELRAGDYAICTFVNLRPGAPAIAIEKSGPALAIAGDTLRYTLHVTNPGDVPLPAAAVRVRDDTCDDPPDLVGKADGDGDDDSPQTLDPGDTWTYACSHATPAAAADCTLTALTNVASADATVGGTTVGDTASITVTLLCPDQPPEPPLPNPGPSSPIAPPGPEPPDAGVAGAASLTMSGRCLSRVSQLRFTGRRISRIRVDVDGRRVRRETIAILQRRATTLARLIGPGRHRISIRVTFQTGSGTPPVTVARTVIVCAAPESSPRFTG